MAEIIECKNCGERFKKLSGIYCKSCNSAQKRKDMQAENDKILADRKGNDK